MKKSVFLLIFTLCSANVSYGLMLRDQGEMFLGITGGYGFPQLGYWGSDTISDRMNKNSKEYSFGLVYNNFLLSNLVLSTELLYTYNQIKMRKDDKTSFNWEGHFVDINLSVHGYWFEFFYFGGGLYGRIPYHSPISNAPGLTNNIQFTLGLLIETGVDMKIFDDFALKIAIRSHLPFMGYHSLSNNHYKLWTFPINFVFALEWLIGQK